MDPEIQQLIANYTPLSDFCPKLDGQLGESQDKPFNPFVRSERITRCCDFSKQTQSLLKDAEDDFEVVGAKAFKKTNKKNVAFVPQAPPPIVQYSSSYYPIGRKNKLAQAAKRVVTYKKCRFKDSINISPSWITVHETQKQSIDKMPLSIIEIAELHKGGTFRRYQSAYDKVKPNFEFQLEAHGCEVISSSIQEDGYLKNLIEERATKDELPTIYTTDKLLLALLTLRFSVYPWDIQLTKKGNQIILDKCPQNKGDITYLELQTINENITIDMQEDEKVIRSFCEESTFAAASWQLQATQKGEVVFQNDQEDKEYLHSDDVGFSYMECTIRDRIEKGPREEPKAGPERFKVVVRTTVEAVDDDDNPVLVKALNECDTPANWRKNLQSQMGLTLNTVQVYNTNSIAKWLCQAQLLNSDTIKIGYLTRQHSKDQAKHSLLLVESYNQKDLGQAINFKPTECWQQLRYLVDFIKYQEDGVYVLLKSAYKTSFRIFRVNDTQDDQEEDENQMM